MNNCTEYISWSRIFKGAPTKWVDARTFLKFSAPLPFMKAFGFITLSARSILLDSAFKVTWQRDGFAEFFIKSAAQSAQPHITSGKKFLLRIC